MQVLTPAVTLAICATFKLERLTGPLLVSILMITLGTGVATAVEVGVAGFAWPGFFSFLFSTLMEAVRVVYIQLLLGKLSYSSMEVCYCCHPSNDVGAKESLLTYTALPTLPVGQMGRSRTDIVVRRCWCTWALRLG